MSPSPTKVGSIGQRFGLLALGLVLQQRHVVRQGMFL